MAIIYSYPFDQKVTDTDSWVGNDSVSRQTKQYTAQAVADYLNINGKVFVAGQMTYQLISDPSEKSGTFAFPLGDGDGTPWSNITSFVIADRDLSKQDVSPFLNYLVGEQIMFQDVSEKRSFGHYIMEGYTQIVGTNFYEMQLKYIGGNGVVTIDNYYTLVNFYLEIGDAKVETIEGLNTTYIDVAPSTPTTGDVQISASLSATDGTSTPLSRFLTKDNKWATVSVANETYTLPVSAGSANSAKIDLTAGGTGSGIKSTVEFKGTTNRISISEVVGNNGNITIDMPDNVTIVNDLTTGGELTVLGTGASSIAGTLGIGLSNPNARLNVDGVIKIEGTNPLTFGGTAAIPDFNIYSSGGDLIIDDVATNINGNVLFTNGGNVGIGTTSPSQKLDVSGNVIIRPLNTTDTISFLSLGSNQSRLVTTDNFAIFNGGLETARFLKTGGLKLAQYGSGSFTGTATQRLAVDTSGNVIEIPIGSGPVDGSGTANYLTKWIDSDTIGNSIAYDSGSQLLLNATSAAFGAKLYINGDSYVTGGYQVGTSSTYVGKLVNSSGILTLETDSNRDIQFKSNANVFMYIDDDGIGGKVGIGTTSPTQKVVIKKSSFGSVNIGATVASGATLLAAGGNPDYGTFFATQGPSDNYTGLIQQRRQSAATFYNLALNPYGGNIGIGTTNPNYKLDVNSDGATGVRINSSSTNAVQLRYENDNNGELAKVVVNNSKLYRIDAENISLNPFGNVGIGTTSPGAKLDVLGSVFVRGGNGLYSNDFRAYSGSDITFHNTGNTTFESNVGIGTTNPSYNLEVRGTADQSLYLAKTGTTYLRATAGANAELFTGGSMVLGSGNTERIRIVSTGNVGIGTTSPSELLHVQGNNATIQTVESGGATVKMRSGSVGRFGTYSNNNLSFVSNSQDRMTIDSSGKVGIACTPGERFEVQGGNVKFKSTTTHQRLYIQSPDDKQSIIYFGDQNSHSIARIAYNNNGDYMYFNTNGGQRMTITSVGNVGIGTTSPAEQLHVNGDVRVDGTGGVATKKVRSSYFSSTQNLDLVSGSSANIILTSSKVGIGTTSPSEKLSVSGNTNITGKLAVGSTASHASFDFYNQGTAYFNGSTTVDDDLTVTNSVTATTFSGDLDGTINTSTTAVTKPNATNDTTVATTAFVQNLIGTIPAGLVFQGTWDASTNTPTLSGGSGTTGHFYIVSTSGSTNLDGITDWKVGDWAVFVEQGATDAWEKVDNSSVLDGSGTGQKVSMWSGSGTSNTITDAPMTISGSNTTFAGDISLSDSKNAKFGNNDDLRIYHSGTNSNIENFTGNLQFVQNTDDGNITFLTDNGAGGTVEYMRIDGSGELVVFSKDVKLQDNDILRFGNANDLKMYHDASNSYISQQGTGHLYIENTQDDSDIIFRSDNGSGGVENYMQIDGSAGRTLFNKHIRVNDNVQIQVGSSADMQIYHNSIDSFIYNGAGDLVLENNANDKDIIFKSDNGSGGTTPYLKLWGAIESLAVYKDMLFVNDGNGGKLKFGASQDLQIYHDGSHSYIDNTTGDIRFQQFADNGKIRFYNDDGTGGTTEYFRLDGDSVKSVFSKPVQFLDNTRLMVGSSNDLEIYHDGSNSYIKDTGTGNLWIQGSSQVNIGGANGEIGIQYVENANVTLRHNNAAKLTTTSTGIDVTGEVKGDSLDIDGAADVSGNAVFHGKTGFGGATSTYNVHAIGTGWSATGVAIESTTTAGAVLSLINTNRTFQVSSRNNSFDVRDITAGDVRRFYIDSSGVSNFEGNVRLTSNSSSFIGRKFVARDGNGTGLFADDAASGLSIADNGNATFSGHVDIGSNTNGKNLNVYGNATGEGMFWTASDSHLTIRHDDGDLGLEIYTVNSTAPTTPQLKIGRNADQYWGVYTSDRDTHLVHRQDETSGEMRTNFEMWDSNVSDNTGSWRWRSGDGSGGNMSTALTLYQDGDAVFSGDINLDSSNINIDGNGAVVFDNTNNNNPWYIRNGGTNSATLQMGTGSPGSNIKFTIDGNGDVGIGTTSPNYKLHVVGGAEAGGVITYSKSAGSLDTTGYAVAGITADANGNGSSCGFTFTCFGHLGAYQKVVYSCYNGAGTWYTSKVIDEGTNDFDIEASANGSTITFTFKSTSGTKYYTPRVTVEATGSNINSTYA